MLYVMTLKWQPGLTREQRDGALMRRAEWKYPEGLRAVGEFWPASNDLAVVFVFEADDYAPIMEVAFTWGDTFAIEVAPAITAEDGLRVGPEVLGRRTV